MSLTLIEYLHNLRLSLILEGEDIMNENKRLYGGFTATIWTV